MAESLPAQLRYLEPVLKELSKIPAKELDEDVDISALEEALRKRVRGLSIRAAQTRIIEDRDALESWMENSDKSVPSITWVVAFLGYRPGALARRLLASPEPETSEPTISFDPPAGWSIEQGTSELNLRKGLKEIGTITAIDEATHALLFRQNEIRDEAQSRNKNQFDLAGKWTRSEIKIGACRGHKYLHRQSGPTSWKSIQYLLEVPGGAVDIMLDAGGKEFDESEFEARLSTLQLE